MTIDPDPAQLLAELGLSDDRDTVAARPLTGGWSGSRLWHVALPGRPPLVLRAFPGSTDAAPRREAAIHALVRGFGIPAPAVEAVGAVSNGAAMAIALMPGLSLARALLGTPHPPTAHALGIAAGAMLARIHAIPGPAIMEAGLGPGGKADPGDWLAWLDPGPRVRRLLAPWTASQADADTRLLHLDFHPENLLADPGSATITAVLDWTNARIGPPVADLARTRSILRLVATIPGLPPGSGPVIAAFERGVLAGYADRHGAPDPAMLLAFDAWALEIQVTDLAPKLAMPGTWVTESTLAGLRAARDDAILRAERAATTTTTTTKR